MHGSLELCQDYALKLDAPRGVDVWVAPPALYTQRLMDSVRAPIEVGVQDVHWEQEGAYTGELAPSMLSDIEASFAVVGHSERRAQFAETDQIVAQKCKSCVDAGIIPIVCVGESLKQRESGIAECVVWNQVSSVLSNLDAVTPLQVVLAYEPIWAIGTGVVANPQDAESMQNHVRSMISNTTDLDAEQIRILYGGSVKVENAASLVAQQNVDGFLVGGASLEVDDFQRICQIASGD